jgi:hypothetical protein
VDEIVVLTATRIGGERESLYLEGSTSTSSRGNRTCIVKERDKILSLDEMEGNISDPDMDKKTKGK